MLVVRRNRESSIARLQVLPQHPELRFCATSVAPQVESASDRSPGGVLSLQRDLVQFFAVDQRHVAGGGIAVRRAVDDVDQQQFVRFAEICRTHSSASVVQEAVDCQARGGRVILR